MTVGTEHGIGLRGAGAELRSLRERAGGRPLAIAHRAGNEPELLQAAEAFGADLIETDVWRYQGRVEVRHLKTLGKLPILWDWEPRDSGWPYPFAYLRDRWRLRFAPTWRPRLTLGDVLRLARPETAFMIDLKRGDLLLADAVVAEARTFRPAPPGCPLGEEAPPIFVCSRAWGVLERAGREPDVRVIYSVGSDEQLAAVWPKLAALPDPAVSIHARYLGKDLPHLARFKAEGVAVVTWPVNDDELALDLTERGADGLIIDDPEVLRRVATNPD